MSLPPLLIFDTNVLMNIWLSRDTQSALLVELAEQRVVELVIPEFVLVEFQGTARRWLREQRAVLDTNVAAAVNAWKRSRRLEAATEQLKLGSQAVRAELDRLPGKIGPLVDQLQQAARVDPHTVELHLRGDLRYLRGDPPDRPVDGIKDCRIYEAVLDVLRRDAGVDRSRRVYLTQDSDFHGYSDLVRELASLNCELVSQPGPLYSQLRHLPRALGPAGQTGV
jgi:hypothetical protein